MNYTFGLLPIRKSIIWKQTFFDYTYSFFVNKVVEREFNIDPYLLLSHKITYTHTRTIQAMLFIYNIYFDIILNYTTINQFCPMTPGSVISVQKFSPFLSPTSCDLFVFKTNLFVWLFPIHLSVNHFGTLEKLIQH